MPHILTPPPHLQDVVHRLCFLYLLLYPELQRMSMPEVLAQWERCRCPLQAQGATFWPVVGYEAQDVLQRREATGRGHWLAQLLTRAACVEGQSPACALQCGELRACIRRLMVAEFGAELEPLGVPAGLAGRGHSGVQEAGEGCAAGQSSAAAGRGGAAGAEAEGAGADYPRLHVHAVAGAAAGAGLGAEAARGAGLVAAAGAGDEQLQVVVGSALTAAVVATERVVGSTPTAAVVAMARVVGSAPTAAVVAMARVAGSAPTAGVVTTARVVGTAPTAGVVSSALTAAVVSSAPTAGVVGTAPTAGVIGTAPKAGVIGLAPTARVIGSAPTAGVVGTAPTAAMFATAGVVGSAPMAAVVVSVPAARVQGGEQLFFQRELSVPKDTASSGGASSLQDIQDCSGGVSRIQNMLEGEAGSQGEWCAICRVLNGVRFVVC